VQDFTADLEKFRESLYKVTPVALYRSVCTSCGDLPFLIGYKVQMGDSEALKAAMELVKNPAERNADDMGGAVRGGEALEGAAQMAANRAIRNGERETEATLATLNEVARKSARLGGQKTIVLVSHGFLVTDQQQPLLADTIDRVLRANMALQVLNSSGLLTAAEGGGMPFDDDTVPLTRSGERLQAASIMPDTRNAQANAPPPGMLGRRFPDVAARDYTMEARNLGAMTLRSLADGTGGEFVENSNDYGRALARLAAPPEYRYVVGFTPSKLEPDGRFHKLAVKVAGSGLTVRTREGYYAPKPGEGLTSAAAKEIEAAVFSRDEVRDLPVDVRTEMRQGEGSAAELVVHAEVDLRYLHYREEGARRWDDVTVVATVFDDNGNFLQGKQQVLKLRLKKETAARVEQLPVEKLESVFQLTPGTYLVRVVARSSAGEALAAASVPVEVN